MLPGETIKSGAPMICPDCKTPVEFKVMYSGAGYYVGTQCNCGPYSRESGYYSTAEDAQIALKEETFSR